MAQEAKANALAFKWFNAYLATKAANGLKPYTEEELAGVQEAMQARMLKAQRGE